MQLSCYVRKTLFPYSYLPLLALKCLPPSSIKTHEAWDEGTNIPFRAEHITVFSFLHIGQLCVPVLNIIYCKRKEFLWGGLEDELIYGSSNKSLGVVLLSI